MARLFLLAFLLSTTCDDPGPPDSGAPPPDAGGTPDAGAVDAGGPLTCEQMLMERQVALDSDGPLTQIHPSVLFDGEGIWVVYNRPDGGGDFDVYATRRDCDGTALVEPFLVQTVPEGNDVDPTVALSGDTLLIAWTTDDGTGGTDNLQVRYRAFGIDGTPRMTEERRLTTSRMGAPIVDNHTGVELAALPDGRFAAAGVRAVPELMRFSAFAQPLTSDGTLDGEALEPASEMMVTHRNAAIDASADGTLWLAYEREPDTGGVAEVRISNLDGAPPEPVIEGLVSSAGPDVLAHQGAVWVAFAGEQATGVDLTIVDVSAPLAERTMRTIGEPTRVEHSPRLAASDDAVAVAYFRQVRGFTNEVLVASVTDPSIEPVQVANEAPAYQPAVTHVMGRYWFVSYAIGTSPDFRLVGRFVQL